MSRKKGALETWYESGLAHVWLPYAQMKTARAPLPVARTHGSRIVLADGRELIDGIASWWTACHGYNHPHIRQAVERQLALMPHVMFGGLVHEQALTLARRTRSIRPRNTWVTDSASPVTRSRQRPPPPSRRHKPDRRCRRQASGRR